MCCTAQGMYGKLLLMSRPLINTNGQPVCCCVNNAQAFMGLFNGQGVSSPRYFVCLSTAVFTFAAPTLKKTYRLNIQKPLSWP
jgi:hypothetical protein